MNGVRRTASEATRHGIRGAEGIERQRRGCGAHRAARDGRRQQQAHRDARHQLRRARAEHIARLADALHAVAYDENAAEEQVHREVDIEQRIAVADRLSRDLVGAQEQPQVRPTDAREQPRHHDNGRNDDHDDERLQRTLPDAVRAARARDSAP